MELSWTERKVKGDHGKVEGDHGKVKGCHGQDCL